MASDGSLELRPRASCVLANRYPLSVPSVRSWTVNEKWTATTVARQSPEGPVTPNNRDWGRESASGLKRIARIVGVRLPDLLCRWTNQPRVALGGQRDWRLRITDLSEVLPVNQAAEDRIGGRRPDPETERDGFSNHPDGLRQAGLVGV